MIQPVYNNTYSNSVLNLEDKVLDFTNLAEKYCFHSSKYSPPLPDLNWGGVGEYSEIEYKLLNERQSIHAYLHINNGLLKDFGDKYAIFIYQLEANWIY